MKINARVIIFALLAAVPASSQTGNYSFWTTNTVPAFAEVQDARSLTLGTKFYTDVPGTVTALRFFKGVHNTGTHIGALWTSTGTKLAEVTFTGETASGWQQANFSPPVSVTANANYVISYFAPNGFFTAEPLYPWTLWGNAPLHAIGVEAGVHTYGTGIVLPTSPLPFSGNPSVDVVFTPSFPLAHTPLLLSERAIIVSTSQVLQLQNTPTPGTELLIFRNGVLLDSLQTFGPDDYALTGRIVSPSVASGGIIIGDTYRFNYFVDRAVSVQ